MLARFHQIADKRDKLIFEEQEKSALPRFYPTFSSLLLK
jgi:hypothetical protein